MRQGGQEVGRTGGKEDRSQEARTIGGKEDRTQGRTNLLPPYKAQFIVKYGQSWDILLGTLNLTCGLFSEQYAIYIVQCTVRSKQFVVCSA